MFIIATCVHAIGVFIGSATALFAYGPFDSSLWTYVHWLTIISLAYSGLFAFLLFLLTMYQICFISGGKTTNEYVRKKENDIWDEGCVKNWKNTFHCSDSEDGYLYINATGDGGIKKTEGNLNNVISIENNDGNNGNTGSSGNNVINVENKVDNKSENNEDKKVIELEVISNENKKNHIKKRESHKENNNNDI